MRMANRPVSKSNLIPARAFEYEQTFLVKIPPYVQGGAAPKHHPRNRKKLTAGEERILRNAANEIDDYLNFILVMKGKARHILIRQLYSPITKKNAH